MSDGEQIAETYLTGLIHSHKCKDCQWYPNCSHLQDGDWCLGKQIEIAKKVMGRILELGYVKLADIDYRYLPVKETYCYDNGWRKVEGI